MKHLKDAMKRIERIGTTSTDVVELKAAVLLALEVVSEELEMLKTWQRTREEKIDKFFKI